MYKKIVGIIICMLSIGISFLPSISGNIELNQEKEVIENIIDVLSIPPNDQLDQYQDNCTGGGIGIDKTYKCAQSFIPSYDTLSRVELFCKKGFFYYENVLVSIRDDLNGNDLTSVLISSRDIPIFGPATEIWTEFNFPDIKVTPGLTYYLIFYPTGGNLQVPIDRTLYFGGAEYLLPDDPYSRGKAFYIGPSSNNIWKEIDLLTADGNADWDFKTYGYNDGNQREIIVNSINGSFGIRADISNIGTEPTYNVNWSIDVEPSFGLIFSGSHKEDVIDELVSGGTTQIQSNNLRGIGLIIITVQAADASKQATAFLLGPLVLRVNEV